MKLPKRLREKRDDHTIHAYRPNGSGMRNFNIGYNQGVEDLMSEVQGLVLACEQLDNANFGDQTLQGCNAVHDALTKWRLFCEVEKDEE